MAPSSSIISASYSVARSWLPPQRSAELRAELRIYTPLQDLAVSILQVVTPLLKTPPRDIQGVPLVGDSGADNTGQLMVIEGTAPSLLLEDDDEEGRMAEEQQEPLVPVSWRYEVVSKFDTFVGAAGIQYQFLPKLSDRIAREQGDLVDFLVHEDTRITAVSLGFEVFKGLIVSGLLGGVPEVRERWQLAAAGESVAISLWTTLKNDPWVDPVASRGAALVQAFANLVHTATDCTLAEIAAAGRRHHTAP